MREKLEHNEQLHRGKDDQTDIDEHAGRVVELTKEKNQLAQQLNELPDLQPDLATITHERDDLVQQVEQLQGKLAVFERNQGQFDQLAAAVASLQQRMDTPNADNTG